MAPKLSSKVRPIALKQQSLISQFYRLDPATLEELGTVPDMGLEETKTAILAAEKAFSAWGKTTGKVCSYLHNFAHGT
jgi:acyl-CoA reductase-like NAD-dependent aldehyde dehydrogenase